MTRASHRMARYCLRYQLLGRKGTRSSSLSNDLESNERARPNSIVIDCKYECENTQSHEMWLGLRIAATRILKWTSRCMSKNINDFRCRLGNGFSSKLPFCTGKVEIESIYDVHAWLAVRYFISLWVVTRSRTMTLRKWKGNPIV